MMIKGTKVVMNTKRKCLHVFDRPRLAHLLLSKEMQGAPFPTLWKPCCSMEAA